MSGGPGTDTATYSDSGAALTLTLDGNPNDGSVQDDNGTRRDNIGADIENVTGGANSDTITGNSGDNVLNGGGGDDLIDGGFGADDIIGGRDSSDRVFYANRSAGVTVTLLGGADDGNADDDNGSRRDNVNLDVELISATNFNDNLTGTNGPNRSAAVSGTT